MRLPANAGDQARGHGIIEEIDTSLGRATIVLCEVTPDGKLSLLHEKLQRPIAVLEHVDMPMVGGEQVNPTGGGNREVGPPRGASMSAAELSETWDRYSRGESLQPSETAELSAAQSELLDAWEHYSQHGTIPNLNSADLTAEPEEEPEIEENWLERAWQKIRGGYSS